MIEGLSFGSVRSEDWFRAIVDRCQVFALRTSVVRHARLRQLIDDLVRGLPEPRSACEAVLLRGALLQLAVGWSARIRRTRSSQCRIRSSAVDLLERHWRDRARPPAATFASWANDFIVLLDDDAVASPVDEAMRLIEQRREQRLDVVQLAREVACHPVRLRRMFREKLGMSMRAYHTEVRVRAALQLLRDPDNKVDAAAVAAGFRSRRCFYGAIRRATGQQPSAQRMRAPAVPA